MMTIETPDLRNWRVLEVPVSLTCKQLLDELEKIFPDKLPSFRDYSPERVLKLIGNQEVIIVIKRLMEET